MLVLSRKEDQWIGFKINREEALAVLDECGEIRIDLCVVEIKGDRARLGVAADRRVKIHRQEIWDEIELLARSRDKLRKVAQEMTAEDDIDDLAQLTEKAF